MRSPFSESPVSSGARGSPVLIASDARAPPCRPATSRARQPRAGRRWPSRTWQHATASTAFRHGDHVRTVWHARDCWQGATAGGPSKIVKADAGTKTVSLPRPEEGHMNRVLLIGLVW